MPVETLSLAELVTLYKHAIPAQRLLLAWCLNCAHGAAEFGRVEWGDLFLKQPHPWQRHGLNLGTSDDDNWAGFLRPKSDVLGWWSLWPETLRLVESSKGRFPRGVAPGRVARSTHETNPARPAGPEANTCCRLRSNRRGAG